MSINCCCYLFLDNTSPKGFLRVSAHQFAVAPQIPFTPPIHEVPIAVVAVVTLPWVNSIPPPVTCFECYHGGSVFGVTQRYSSLSPAPLCGVRVAGFDGAAATGWGYSRRPSRGGKRLRCLQRWFLEHM